MALTQSQHACSLLTCYMFIYGECGASCSWVRLPGKLLNVCCDDGVPFLFDSRETGDVLVRLLLSELLFQGVAVWSQQPRAREGFNRRELHECTAIVTTQLSLQQKLVTCPQVYSFGESSLCKFALKQGFSHAW